MYDALVVGGGIVGTAAAYHLVREGADVALVDRSDDGRATHAGAGILSPATNTRDPDAWFAFATDAVAFYETLVDRLAADGERDAGYARSDLLKVAVDEAEAEAFDDALDVIRARQAASGVPDDEEFYELTPEAARERLPVLADVERACCYEGAARVDGGRVTAAMGRAAERRGLEAHTGNVTRLDPDGGGVTVETADGERRRAERVVVAGGAWSAAFGDALGVSIPVAPQRGQISHLDPGVAGVDDWPIVSAFRGHYMLPWGEGRLVAGATRETGSGFDPRVTVDGVREVLDEATRVAPGLGDATLLELRVGLRPQAADTLPILGALPGHDRVFVATGHGPTGLQLGPYSGTLVAEEVLGRDHEETLAAFRPDRFA